MLTTAACGGVATNVEPLSAPAITEPSVQKVVKSGPPIEPVDVTSLWVRRRGDRIWATDARPPRPAGAGRHTGCARVASELDVCTASDVSPALRWTLTGGDTWTRIAAPIHGVLPGFVPSLVPGAMAMALGGDGATLFPLLRVLLSTNYGETWTTYEVPEVDEERRFTTGHVLLSDGRLLVVVEAWSDDRLDHHSKRHHGFFVSDPADLGDLHPVEPKFVPPLDVPERGEWGCCTNLYASTDPDPVIWTTTWDRRIYASTDDGRTFREVPLP
jgi:hypothetical protein